MPKKITAKEALDEFDSGFKREQFANEEAYRNARRFMRTLINQGLVDDVEPEPGACRTCGDSGEISVNEHGDRAMIGKTLTLVPCPDCAHIRVVEELQK